VTPFFLTLTIVFASADAGVHVPRPIEPRDDVDVTGAITDAGTAAPAPAADAGVAAEQVPGVIVTARVEPDPVKFGDTFELVVTL